MLQNQRLYRSTHPWTAAQDQTLRRLINDRESVHAISQRLRRSESAVMARACELGVQLSRIQH